jgi:hypothetical protein
VTLVEIRPEHRDVQYRTVACAICGARAGEEFQRFSYHLATHSPADLGLGGDGR